MEGLFIIVAIFIGIANFAAKQQKQASRRGQQSQRSQNPVQRQRHIPQSPKRTAMDMEKGWGEGLKGAVEYKPVSMFADEDEGIEIEDRRKAGSMDYIENSHSSEGIDSKQPLFRQEKKKEKKVAPREEIIDSEEDSLFVLTEDDLMRSIVMAEVLGPPRAIKRRIR